MKTLKCPELWGMGTFRKEVRLMLTVVEEEWEVDRIQSRSHYQDELGK